jgi:hypothetical protein
VISYLALGSHPVITVDLLDPEAIDHKRALAPQFAHCVERWLHVRALYAVCDSIAIDQLKRLMVFPGACPMVAKDSNPTVRQNACHAEDQELERPCTTDGRLSVGVE